MLEIVKGHGLEFMSLAARASPLVETFWVPKLRRLGDNET
jgi:hypothetical protein